MAESYSEAIDRIRAKLDSGDRMLFDVIEEAAGDCEWFWNWVVEEYPED